MNDKVDNTFGFLETFDLHEVEGNLYIYTLRFLELRG